MNGKSDLNRRFRQWLRAIFPGHTQSRSRVDSGCKHYEIARCKRRPKSPMTRSPRRVLFVCLGNICRSPAAENILRHQARIAGCVDEFEIDSAGTIGHQRGSPPDLRMSEALRRRGFKSEGQARQIEAADLRRFDLIVTMDEANLADVRRLDASGKLHGKIRSFVSFCRHHQDARVPDPYYGGELGFQHVIGLLEDGCRGILESLQGKGRYQEITSSEPL